MFHIIGLIFLAYFLDRLFSDNSCQKPNIIVQAPLALDAKGNPMPIPSMDDKGEIRWHLNHKIHRVDGPAIEHPDGTKEWYLYGRHHRVDGPAIEKPNGTKEWWLHGKLHRTDGPAVEDANGNKTWFLYGQAHREDGPASEFNGNKTWYYHGKKIDCSSQQEFERLLKTEGLLVK